VKPQYVDRIPKAVRGADKTVSTLIETNATLGNLQEVLDVLELNHIMDRDINLLSGGELQRFAIGTVCVQQADVYVTNFLRRKCASVNPSTGTCLTSLLPTLTSSNV
jgi:ATP-binding cassette subfamily E protein 1